MSNVLYSEINYCSKCGADLPQNHKLNVKRKTKKSSKTHHRKHQS